MVYDLKLSGQVCPLGVDGPCDFSWLVKTSSGADQASYRVRVAHSVEALLAGEDLVWDSGVVETGQTNGVAFGGELEAFTAYAWNVEVAYADGAVETSDYATFECGPLSAADWGAQWVSSPFERHGEYFVTEFIEEGNFDDTVNKDDLNAPVHFREEFSAKKDVARARLYATAHGVYDVEVNGVAASDVLLAPGYTTYGELLYFQTYDVTDLLRDGVNALGITAADGWYSGYIGGPGIQCQYGEDLSVLYQLVVTYADGSRQVVAKGENVVCSKGQIRYSDLYIGEFQDHTVEIGAWSTPGYDASSWAPAVAADFGYANLASWWFEPVRVTDVLPLRERIETPAGELVLDFGQVLSGRAVLNVVTEAPVRITLDHTEVLTRDGNYVNNVMGANKDQQDVFVTAGIGTERLCTRFTYHGFRYVRMTADGPFELVSAEVEVIGSDLPVTGDFSCSDPRLNQLQHNILWSQKANFLSIPTDCPQREKMGWTGDIQVFAPTAAFNMDTRAFLRSWMRNLEIDQLEDGRVPHVVPFTPIYRDTVCAHLGSCCSTGWGDASVIVPWAQYQRLGDKRVLADSFDAMKAWVDYGISRSAEGVPEKYADCTDAETLERQKYLWNTDFHWGDWLLPSIVMSDGKIDMFLSSIGTRALVAPAMFARLVDVMAQACKALGKDEEAAFYRDYHGKVREAFIAEYLADDGSIITDFPFQGIYVLVLAFGLYPAEKREAVLSHLLEMIEDNGGLHDTGFLSVPFLLDTLVESGAADVAYRMLFEDRCPSWLYEVKMGATTTWEAWQAMLADGSPTNVSYNHYANGCVGDFIYRRIGGLTATEPGYKAFDVRPDYRCGLNQAKLGYDSVNGRIEVAWQRFGDQVELTVAVPQNTRARVWADGSWAEATCGTHRYVVSAARF